MLQVENFDKGVQGASPFVGSNIKSTFVAFNSYYDKKLDKRGNI